MPSQTNVYRLPFPLGTDRVMDGDDQIRRLAQSVENMVQSGTTSVNITAVNTTASVTVTFPVAFNQPPVVFVNPNSANGPGTLSWWVTGATTTTQCVIQAQATGGLGPRPFMWVAIGPVTTVS